MSDIFALLKSLEKKETFGTPTHMLVGLGNPGAEYVNTRHNMGFMALDYISQRLNVDINRARFHALYGMAEIGGVKAILVKPQTYMNASGEAVREISSFYRIPVENILVVSDDINLDVGRMRVRKSGSDGGQKGLRSIIYQMNSDSFPRMRIGVGLPKCSREERGDLADWVLGHFDDNDKKTVFELFEVAYKGVGMIFGGDIDAAIQYCNSAGTK